MSPCQPASFLSSRACCQQRLAGWVAERRVVFDSPGGVACGFRFPTRGGRIRTVSFGRRGVLGVVVEIRRPDDIEVVASGAFSGLISGRYSGVDEVTKVLSVLVARIPGHDLKRSA